jgi:hypothetical protein
MCSQFTPLAYIIYQIDGSNTSWLPGDNASWERIIQTVRDTDCAPANSWRAGMARYERIHGVNVVADFVYPDVWQ